MASMTCAVSAGRSHARGTISLGVTVEPHGLPGREPPSAKGDLPMGPDPFPPLVVAWLLSGVPGVGLLPAVRRVQVSHATQDSRPGWLFPVSIGEQCSELGGRVLTFLAHGECP